jgi:hypothetical protein
MKSRSSEGQQAFSFIPSLDDSAAELGFCRTYIQAQLRKARLGSLDSAAMKVLQEILSDLQEMELQNE